MESVRRKICYLFSARQQARALTLLVFFTCFVSARAQQDGPAAVQSNGVSISFQNAGGDAKGSNGVSISFQNAGSAESGTSSGVTIGFRDGFNPRGALGNNPNSGTHADPVNTATGNFVFDKTDMTVAGRGFGFEFKRFYNSQDGSTGPLGVSWTHSYNLKVVEDLPANTVTVTLDDGHDEVYERVGSDYNPKFPGIYNNLVKNPDNTFTVTRKDKRRFNFRTNGQLATIVDRNDNTAILDYDATERLTRVNIPGGRHVNFAYDAQNRLASVTDALLPSARTVSYGYDANNNLTSVTDVRGNVWLYTYDSQHQMLTARDPRNNIFVTNIYDDSNRVVTHQTDAKGNATEFEYLTGPVRTKITDPQDNVSYDYHDSFKRMIRQQDRFGKSYSYTYDSQNNRASVTDKNTRTTQYEYDSNGNVIKQTDPFGRTVVITYNANNDPLTRTDELGNVTSFEYDPAGNLTRTIEPLGKITNYAYDGFGQLRTVTDARTQVTTNTYDGSGNLTLVATALNNTTNYGYDSIGRRISMTDARTKTTTFAYDKSGNLLSVTDPLSNTVSYQYDPNGNRTRITDARGAVTQFEYDANNLLFRVTDARGGITLNTYDSLDRKIEVKDPRNFTTNFDYDLEGRLKQFTDPLGNVTQYQYDSQGNRTKLVDPKGNATTFEFDRLNRLIRTTDPLGNRTTTSYDAIGRVIKTEDALGRTTRFFFDALGRVTTVTDPANNDTIFTYDLIGNRLTVKNPNNQTTSFTYDDVNRLVSKTNPLGKTYTYTYDAVGNLSRKVDPNGAQIDYTYDGNNRNLTVVYPNATSVNFTYDVNGNRTLMVDSVGTSSYVYDLLNRLTNYTDAYGKTIGYEYDANSNRTALIYPDSRRMTYTFDPANRMTNAVDWAGRSTTYSYDPSSLLTGQANAKGTTAGWSYDNAGRLVAMNNKKSDKTMISSYGFTLNPVGNRTNINQTEPLIAGNAGVDTAYSYNAANQILTAGPTTFSSDLNGNLKTQTTGMVTRIFNYDFEDRLVNGGDGTTAAQYVYNGDGTRLAKTINGMTTRFVVDPTSRLQRVLAETDSSGTITDSYIHGLGLIARVTPTATYYQYHYDVRGSTVAITNSTQNLVNRYLYDPFGVLISSAEQITNPFLYMGQHGVTREPFDLLFASRRFYNPVLGRFLTKDPVEGVLGNPQTFNEYIYSLNNPVMMMDPSGLSGQGDGTSAFSSLGSSDSPHWTLFFAGGLLGNLSDYLLKDKPLSFALEQLLFSRYGLTSDALKHLIRVRGTSLLLQRSEAIPILGGILSTGWNVYRDLRSAGGRDWADTGSRIAIDITAGSVLTLGSIFHPALGTAGSIGYDAYRDDLHNRLQNNFVTDALGQGALDFWTVNRFLWNGGWQ